MNSIVSSACFVTDCGFINIDSPTRTDVPHIFAIGDTVGQPVLPHKAVHEAHVAAEVIACELQGNWKLASAAFNARAIPSVSYTDPEVAWVRTHAGDMISEIALTVEIGAHGVDIGKTISPHPTLGESVGMAAEMAHGSCTDLPSACK